MALGDAMLLLYPALTGTQITNYCAAIDHFNPYSSYATFGWMTGANTSDKVLVMLLRGIAGRSTNSMVTAQTNLSPVFLYVTTGDGFYGDGSFVFHSNGSTDGVAYNGHYGLVLLGDIPEIVDLLQVSTDWKITDPNLANVYAWVTNSFEPFLYNGTMMDTVRGRIVSWSYETGKNTDGTNTLFGDETDRTIRAAGRRHRLHQFYQFTADRLGTISFSGHGSRSGLSQRLRLRPQHGVQPHRGL